MSIVNVEALKQNGCELWWQGGPSSSNAPKTIASNGNVKQLLPFPGAGVYSGPAYTDYLRIPTTSDLTFTDNTDFTIEFWINARTRVNNTGFTLIGNIQYNNPGGWGITEWCTDNTIRYWGYWDNANGWILNGTAYYVENVDTHWAVVRRTEGSNKIFRLFRNGIKVMEATGNGTIGNAGYPFSIGQDPGTPRSNIYLGTTKISELRISNVARYTANFTPPRRQLESDSNTKLLIHFNRNDSTFIDSSPSAYTITAYGNAKQLCSPCGSGVAYFDGNGDYLTTPDHTDWNFGLNDFTIECDIYITNLGLLSCIYDNSSNTSNYSYCNVNTSGSITWRIGGSSGDIWNISSETGKITLNTWHHVAFVRSGNTQKIYIDGIQTGNIGTSNGAIPDFSDVFCIGYRKLYADCPYWGYISEFRVSNVARYTNNFTPSTLPIKPDSYTKLLLHMDGTGQAFYDSSDPPGDNGFPILPAGVSITPNGTFTSVKGKDGRNYWKFDGSTNYLTISDHDVWSMFLNDFTISAWVKFDSVAANKIIIGQYTDANNQWYLQCTTGNVIQLYGITSSTAQFNFSCPLTAVANTWYHVVVERSGSSCIMYINGVAQTVTQTTAFSATATNIAAVLSIGKINTGYQTGNIKDLQIFTESLTQDQVGALYRETFIY